MAHKHILNNHLKFHRWERLGNLDFFPLKSISRMQQHISQCPESKLKMHRPWMERLVAGYLYWMGDGFHSLHRVTDKQRVSVCLYINQVKQCPHEEGERLKWEHLQSQQAMFLPVGQTPNVVLLSLLLAAIQWLKSLPPWSGGSPLSTTDALTCAESVCVLSGVLDPKSKGSELLDSQVLLFNSLGWWRRLQKGSG